MKELIIREANHYDKKTSSRINKALGNRKDNLWFCCR